MAASLLNGNIAEVTHSSMYQFYIENFLYKRVHPFLLNSEHIKASVELMRKNQVEFLSDLSMVIRPFKCLLLRTVDFCLCTILHRHECVIIFPSVTTCFIHVQVRF